jgi:hypothetical protein
MSNRLFDDKYDAYTEDARSLDSETIKVIKPVFFKYIALGFTARDISQIMQSTIQSLEAETRITQAMNIRKRERREK